MEAVIYGEAPAEVQAALRTITRLPVLDGQTGTISLGETPDDAVEPLVKHGILCKSGDTAAQVGSASALITDRLYQTWKTDIDHLMDDYMSVLNQCLPDINRWIDSRPPCGWLRWTALAGWLLDVEVNRILAARGWFGPEPGLQVWFLEQPDRSLPEFGVRIQVNEAMPAVFGELWLGGLRKNPPLPINLRPDDIAALACVSDRGQTDLDLSRSRYFRLITGAGGCLQLTIPHLDRDDWDGFSGALEQAASAIADETLLGRGWAPAILPAGGPATYRHAFARVLMRVALSRLLRTQILEPAPRIATAEWGTWLASGPEAVRHFSPRIGRDQSC